MALGGTEAGMLEIVHRGKAHIVGQVLHEGIVERLLEFGLPFGRGISSIDALGWCSRFNLRE